MIFVIGGAEFIGSNSFTPGWQGLAGTGEPVVNLDELSCAGTPPFRAHAV